VVAIGGSSPTTLSALNTTGDWKRFPSARLPDVILPGPFMTEEALKQAIASLEARAEAAKRNGLPDLRRQHRVLGRG
jgi:hypothetical protein